LTKRKMVYAMASELLKGLNFGAISGVAAFGTGLAPKLLRAIKVATGYYMTGILIVAGMAAVVFVFSLILYRYCKKRDFRVVTA
jgi:hypothetical protein